MTVQKLIAIPLTALVLAATLAGCANTSQRTADEPTQTATAAATPTAAPTSAAPAPVTTPGPVAAGATVAAGLKTVSLSDGTTYALDPAVPVPAPVLADLAKPITALLADTASKHNVNLAAIDGQASVIDAQTGRTTIVLNRQWTSPDGSTYMWRFYADAAGNPDGIAKSTKAASKAQLLSNVTAWMATHGGAAKFDLVDGTGV